MKGSRVNRVDACGTRKVKQDMGRGARSILQNEPRTTEQEIFVTTELDEGTMWKNRCDSLYGRSEAEKVQKQRNKLRKQKERCFLNYQQIPEKHHYLF